MQPWKLLADPTGYIFTWLVGYSGGLGSIGGVLIADYWIIRKQNLVLKDLYDTKGSYRFVGGWNPSAMAALVIGCALAWGGKVIPTLAPLYDYGWFVGFGAAFVTYIWLMRSLERGPKGNND
jgi:NCS1 family nucleobase:cation symporter-1